MFSSIVNSQVGERQSSRHRYSGNTDEMGMCRREKYAYDLVPFLHVVRVRPQISPRLVELIVKLQVEVVRLQIDRGDNGGYGTGEFAEAIENVLRLQRHTFFEVFAVNLGRGSDSGRLPPRPGCVLMEGPA